jgi:Ca2+:H+ antiporter
MMLVATISLMVPSAFHRMAGITGSFENENTLNVGLSVILLIAYALYLIFMLVTHPDFFKNTGNKTEEEQKEQWSLKRALIMLLVSSAMVAFLSEILVGAAEETGKELGMSSVFIGIIFLAIVGAAGNIPAITMAAKGKMDLSIGIVLGSSIQISLFVAPLLVLGSLLIGPSQLNLLFSKALIIIIFLSVLLGTVVAGDGRSNWYKGVQLIIMYLIIALLMFFVPVVS